MGRKKSIWAKGMRREKKCLGKGREAQEKRMWGEGMRSKNKVFGTRERGARNKIRGRE